MEGNRCPRTLTLQLDFDKSLRTPKVTAQDTYYSSRLKTHLLGIYCANDRRFGTIQTLFKRREVIATPRQWATVLEESDLANVRVCWVTLDMIKDFKSFLRLRYVSRNEDIGKVRFEVKNIAWLNFGYGEEIGDNQELQLVHHPDIVFIRFQMNQNQNFSRFYDNREGQFARMLKTRVSA